MIFITGDTHGDWTRLKQPYINQGDTVIVTGDFGIWDNSKRERRGLESLSRVPYKILFVDGNHENFDMLNSSFPIVDFCGGKVHKIKDNIYHLMRGNIFEIEGKRFFTFGGASSHDIQDGILDRENFSCEILFEEAVARKRENKEFFRINHVSWWKEEMPSKEEMDYGEKILEANNWCVDYIITHCLPTDVQTVFSGGRFKPDGLTNYFMDIAQKVKFTKWFSGHYHADWQYYNYRIIYNRFCTV